MRGAVFGSTAPGASLGDLLPDILARRLIGLPTELWIFLLVALVVGRLFARPAAGAARRPLARSARRPPSPCCWPGRGPC
ncbi:MAG: hypothetical protein M5U29_00325 [Anaerolineae bacterium]|nr:hypothetical protein [Anaerolineae bacterium]